MRKRLCPPCDPQTGEAYWRSSRLWGMRTGFQSPGRTRSAPVCRAPGSLPSPMGNELLEPGFRRAGCSRPTPSAIFTRQASNINRPGGTLLYQPPINLKPNLRRPRVTPHLPHEFSHKPHAKTTNALEPTRRQTFPLPPPADGGLEDKRSGFQESAKTSTHRLGHAMLRIGIPVS